jgi:hypothetical protein
MNPAQRWVRINSLQLALLSHLVLFHLPVPHLAARKPGVGEYADSVQFKDAGTSAVGYCQ